MCNPNQPVVQSTVNSEESVALFQSQTNFHVLGLLSGSHLLNDMIQSLILAIYMLLKREFNLNFVQIGLITLIYQLAPSMLQPLIGIYTDKRPQPYSLTIGLLTTGVGLFLLSVATQFYMLLAAVTFIGLGSAILHPEAGRMVRYAAGTRFGLAQSIFQVGGNLGTALGPLTALWLLSQGYRIGLHYLTVIMLLAAVVLLYIGYWYRNVIAGTQMQEALASDPLAASPATGQKSRSDTRVKVIITILLFAMVSKYCYIAVFNSYYIFYLTQCFTVSETAAQLFLALFLAAVALGTVLGGPLSDRFGRLNILVFSALGTIPFSLILPHVGLWGTGCLSFLIGVLLALSFPSILVCAQSLVPKKIGLISGLFFGLAAGISSLCVAGLGQVADVIGMQNVYRLAAYFPLIGIGVMFLWLPTLAIEPEKPRIRRIKH